MKRKNETWQEKRMKLGALVLIRKQQCIAYTDINILSPSSESVIVSQTWWWLRKRTLNTHTHTHRSTYTHMSIAKKKRKKNTANPVGSKRINNVLSMYEFFRCFAFSIRYLLQHGTLHRNAFHISLRCHFRMEAFGGWWNGRQRRR